MLPKFTVSALTLCILAGTYPLTVYSQEQKKTTQIKKNVIKKNIGKENKQTPAYVVDCNGQTCTYFNPIYNPERVTIGSYINQDSLYDGTDLIVNVPSVREAARLLLRHLQIEKESVKLGIPEPHFPRLTFSGFLEGQASYTKPYTGSAINSINFTGAELDSYVEASDWASGYMALDYDSSELANGSRVFLNRAFITIGNLNKAPAYGVIGQVYVPFGRYSTAFITTPITLAVGRTRARSLMLGFQQVEKNSGYGEIYSYQGLTTPVNQANTMNEWGADAGYNFQISDKISGYIGSSYISNLADSQGAQGTIFVLSENLNHRVGAGDLYGSLAINPFVFIAEYIVALQSFNINDVPYVNHGAKPKAYRAEVDYTFHTFGKPSSFGVEYGGSQQALAFGVPEQRYGAVYNINLLRDTNLAIEYRHDVNYPASAATVSGPNTFTPRPTPPNIAADLGRSDNVITAQFDLYF